MLVYLHFTDKIHIMSLNGDVNYQKVLQYAIELQEPFIAAQVVTSLNVKKSIIVTILQKLTDVTFILRGSNSKFNIKHFSHLTFRKTT